MDLDKVNRLVQEAVMANESLFLVEYKISGDNKIFVSVDGDNGVSLSECIRISRHIEHNLLEVDVEREFSLEVTSPGADLPIVNPRQYNKNIGRTLEIILNNDEKYEGELLNADQKQITISWEAKEKKLIGKGNQKVTKVKEILLDEIKKAIVLIKF